MAEIDGDEIGDIAPTDEIDVIRCCFIDSKPSKKQLDNWPRG
jgi:hypothetical protein